MEEEESKLKDRKYQPEACYNCWKAGHISRKCIGERQNNEGRGNGNRGGRRMMEMEQIWFFRREFQQRTAGNSRDEET